MMAKKRVEKVAEVDTGNPDDAGWFGAISGMCRENNKKRAEARKRWLEALGEPHVEVTIDEGLIELSTYGIWHLKGGIIVVPKSATGYYPEASRPYTDTLLDAMAEARRHKVAS